MNENFEKYIEGLSPELQEKARQCKTREELNEFIADNDLELPEDALEIVNGGCGTPSHPKGYFCNKCDVKVQAFFLMTSAENDFFICPNCGKLSLNQVTNYV